MTELSTCVILALQHLIARQHAVVLPFQVFAILSGAADLVALMLFAGLKCFTHGLALKSEFPLQTTHLSFFISTDTIHIGYGTALPTTLFVTLLQASVSSTLKQLITNLLATWNWVKTLLPNLAFFL